MWVILAFLSAALLGFYDVFKKMGVNKNAVIPVLFLNTIFCSLIFLPLIVASRYFPEFMQSTIFYVPQQTWDVHIYIVIKAFIVLTSWLFAYYAMKNLPITLSAPIKASQPVLTLIGALVIYGERLNGLQWVGVLIALFSFYLLSLSGKKEGIVFKNNKWIWFMVVSIIAGSMSGLYDKYLMTRFDRMTVLSYYSFYQAIIMLVVMLTVWYPRRKENTPFQWRSCIPLISIFLCAADFAYFYALSSEDAMISIVSMIRRSGVLVSFSFGALIFHEKNLKSKAIDLVLVLIGMLFIYFGSK